MSLFCNTTLFEFCSPFLTDLQQLGLPQYDSAQGFFFPLSANYSILTLYFFHGESLNIKTNLVCVWIRGWWRVNSLSTDPPCEHKQGWSRKCLNFDVIWIQICSSFWMGLAKSVPSISGWVVTRWKKQSSFLCSFPFTKHANPILLLISLKHIHILPNNYCLP